MKDFDSWNTIKKATEENSRPHIKKGHIYWCRLGVNIGVEQDGKNKDFRRPVLILKKFSHEIILVAPLTTQKHKGDWYCHFTFDSVDQWAILNQL